MPLINTQIKSNKRSKHRSEEKQRKIERYKGKEAAQGWRQGGSRAKSAVMPTAMLSASLITIFFIVQL